MGVPMLLPNYSVECVLTIRLGLRADEVTTVRRVLSGETCSDCICHVPKRSAGTLGEKRGLLCHYISSLTPPHPPARPHSPLHIQMYDNICTLLPPGAYP